MGISKEALAQKDAAYDEHCDETMPTATAAKILFQKTTLFSSAENARYFVRGLRGEVGKAKRKKTERTGRLKPAPNKRVLYDNRFFNLVADPDPHSNPTTPVHLKLEGKGAVINDVHMPYHDKEALCTALDYIIDKQEHTDFLLINGDFIDAHAISKYNKNPMSRPLECELQQAIEHLIILRGEFKRIIYKMGNHEKRIEDALYKDAPQFANMRCLTYSSLFEAHKIDIEIVHPQQIMYQGDKLAIVHGHELPGGAYSPVNTAKGLMNKTNACGLVGHHHQTSNHSDKDIFDTFRSTWSVGCLCDLRPPFMPVNRWNHGFALLECEGNDFHVDNKRIIKGKVY